MQYHFLIRVQYHFFLGCRVRVMYREPEIQKIEDSERTRQPPPKPAKTAKTAIYIKTTTIARIAKPLNLQHIFLSALGTGPNRNVCLKALGIQTGLLADGCICNGMAANS